MYLVGIAFSSYLLILFIYIAIVKTNFRYLKISQPDIKTSEMNTPVLAPLILTSFIFLLLPPSSIFAPCNDKACNYLTIRLIYVTFFMFKTVWVLHLDR